MNDQTATHEIEAVFARLVELWNRHDVKQYAAMWADDSDFFNVLGMNLHGRQELLSELEYLHAGRFNKTQIRTEHHTVKLLTPELALAHLWWEMNGDPGMPGHPSENGRRHGIFTHVMRLTPQGWRFIASQNTDVLPIADPLRAHHADRTAAPA